MTAAPVLPDRRLRLGMVRAGETGEVRSIAVEYLPDYQTRLDDPDHWHNDPARSGPFGAIGAIGRADAGFTID